MAQCTSSVRTFTVGFDERRFEERRYARMVAERYGTDHDEFIVTPSALDMLSDRGNRHSVRLVDNENVLIAMNDAWLFEWRRLRWDFPSIKDEQPVAVWRLCRQR